MPAEIHLVTMAELRAPEISCFPDHVRQERIKHPRSQLLRRHVPPMTRRRMLLPRRWKALAPGYVPKIGGPHGYCGLEGTGVSCPLPFALGVTLDSQS